MITVGEVYREIDRMAPFCTQEKWDNSGLLVGAPHMPADRMYISLDLSNASVAAARAVGAQLMVSHHPVIFSPLKQLIPTDPVWQLAAANMAAICVHTPLDLAEGGINRRLYDKLRDVLDLQTVTDTLGGSGFGWIAESRRDWNAERLAQSLQRVLGCQVVRYCPAARPIRKIALCSGSGGSFLHDAIEQGCDGLITGDIKHDCWYGARNAGMALFDCGHYHTELVAQELLAERLCIAFPDAEIICDTQGDPVSYVWGGTEK
ncbi:MAG: Nif3-like dinuclear metal center hexameric protein [Ruminococcus sp.]